MSAPTPTMQDLLTDGATTIAVVGATDDPTKFGHRIYCDLKAKGFDVVPVNLHRDTVDGDRAYRRLADLPGPPDIVNFVVPPDQTLDVLHQAEDLGLRRVWVQPGAEDGDVMGFLEAGAFDYVAKACIMVRTRSVADS